MPRFFVLARHVQNLLLVVVAKLALPEAKAVLRHHRNFTNGICKVLFNFCRGYRLRLPSSRAALWCVPAIPLCSFRNEPHRPLHCATGSRSQGSIHKTECSPANYGAPVPGCIPSGSFSPADTVPYHKSSHPGWNRRILSADKRLPLMHGNRVRAGRALRRLRSRRAAPRPSDSGT